jgi:hypothetical protein
VIYSTANSAAEFILRLQQERGFCDAAREMYHYAWQGLGRFCGRWDIEVDDETCGRFLSYLQKIGRSAHYIHSVRASLAVVRNAAHDKGIGSRPHIRPVKLPDLHPQRWTQDEVANLVRAAHSVQGLYGIRRTKAHWWSTAIRGAWHLGVRWKDQMRLEKGQFDSQGICLLEQHKTGKLVPISLPLDFLGDLPTGRMWPWPYTYECFRKTFAAIVEASSIRPGPWKRLRKSAGNAAEELAPGRGHEFLGNERRTFEKYYLEKNGHPVVILPQLKQGQHNEAETSEVPKLQKEDAARQNMV